MLGVIAPEVELIVKPAGVEVYVPPEKEAVPFNVTACAVDNEAQNGEPA